MLSHLKVASITKDALEFFGPCVLVCIKLARVGTRILFFTFYIKDTTESYWDE